MMWLMYLATKFHVDFNSNIGGQTKHHLILPVI